MNKVTELLNNNEIKVLVMNGKQMLKVQNMHLDVISLLAETHWDEALPSLVFRLFIIQEPLRNHRLIPCGSTAVCLAMTVTLA